MSIVREDSYVIIDLCSYMTRCGVGVNDPNRLPAYQIPTVVGELSTTTAASSAAEEAAKDDTTLDEAEPAAETADSDTKPTVGSTSQPTYVVGESALRKLTDKDSAPVWPMASDHVDDWDRMVIFW
ncbi:hypothetical protein IWQ60_012593 [Tieghemiomyces parasiticus]|uniref:Uncharacterized protein n=1 Tax=Tieghemiomyces parasiticus TaxID=78921 RepID=A0A9W7ZF10_9FUNG|nr:hypothetical protein IWQ60_012593 [Tieghemiomyces parasiticus]